MSIVLNYFICNTIELCANLFLFLLQLTLRQLKYWRMSAIFFM